MITGKRKQEFSPPPTLITNRVAGVLAAAFNRFGVAGKFLPAGVLIILITGIALAEVIAMVVVYFVRGWPYAGQVLLDATVMTAIITPLLYYLSFKPLLLQIQQRTQSEGILQARLRLMQYANTHTVDELLQFTLDEIEVLTGSNISFFHFLETGEETIRLKAWSTNTLNRMCKAVGKDSHYEIERAGVWADAARHQRPVIHNDYRALPNRKGMPEGHAQILRELVVPVIRQNSVVAILGIGNKPQDYSGDDVKLASTFADFAWDVALHKISENALQQSEEKFRTIANWTYDWEKWVDPHGDIVYTSPSCERITGYTPDELVADPALLTSMVHPEDRSSYEDHLAVIHQPAVDAVRIEYRIIARDGSERWLEHVCRPVVGSGGSYLGRRVSNRDITQRKESERKISEQKQKEAVLTQTIQTIQTDIARDLHDTLGQNISYLRLSLDLLKNTEPCLRADVQAMLQKMTGVADESYDLIRSMLSILQSGYSADPIKLFSRYAEQVADRSTFQVNIFKHGQPKQLSPNQTRQLFYIWREALSNIEKHAGAHCVSGEFHWKDNSLKFIVADDGCGFDMQATQISGHYGLTFMRERTQLLNGRFLLHSAPGKGVTISVEIPYEFEISIFPEPVEAS